MKKITITAKYTKTYEVIFNKDIVNKEFIDNYSWCFSRDITDIPTELQCLDIDINEEDFAYFNLARFIAYSKIKYGVVHIDTILHDKTLDSLPIDDNPIGILISEKKQEDSTVEYANQEEEYDYETDVEYEFQEF